MGLAAAAVGLGSTASADPYKDFAAQGYRWVAVDGPYACPSKDDLLEITKHRTDRLELQMVQDLRAYYLIRGVIIQVIQEDAARLRLRPQPSFQLILQPVTSANTRQLREWLRRCSLGEHLIDKCFL